MRIRDLPNLQIPVNHFDENENKVVSKINAIILFLNSSAHALQLKNIPASKVIDNYHGESCQHILKMLDALEDEEHVSKAQAEIISVIKKATYPALLHRKNELKLKQKANPKLTLNYFLNHFSSLSKSSFKSIIHKPYTVDINFVYHSFKTLLMAPFHALFYLGTKTYEYAASGTDYFIKKIGLNIENEMQQASDSFIFDNSMDTYPKGIKDLIRPLTQGVSINENSLSGEDPEFLQTANSTITRLNEISELEITKIKLQAIYYEKKLAEVDISSLEAKQLFIVIKYLANQLNNQENLQAYRLLLSDILAGKEDKIAKVRSLIKLQEKGTTKNYHVRVDQLNAFCDEIRRLGPLALLSKKELVIFSKTLNVLHAAIIKGLTKPYPLESKELRNALRNRLDNINKLKNLIQKNMVNILQNEEQQTTIKRFIDIINPESQISNFSFDNDKFNQLTPNSIFKTDENEPQLTYKEYFAEILKDYLANNKKEYELITALKKPAAKARTWLAWIKDNINKNNLFEILLPKEKENDEEGKKLNYQRNIIVREWEAFQQTVASYTKNAETMLILKSLLQGLKPVKFATSLIFNDNSMEEFFQSFESKLLNIKTLNGEELKKFEFAQLYLVSKEKFKLQYFKKLMAASTTTFKGLLEFFNNWLLAETNHRGYEFNHKIGYYQGINQSLSLDNNLFVKSDFQQITNYIFASFVNFKLDNYPNIVLDESENKLLSCFVDFFDRLPKNKYNLECSIQNCNELQILALKDLLKLIIASHEFDDVSNGLAKRIHALYCHLKQLNASYNAFRAHQYYHYQLGKTVEDIFSNHLKLKLIVNQSNKENFTINNKEVVFISDYHDSYKTKESNELGTIFVNLQTELKLSDSILENHILLPLVHELANSLQDELVTEKEAIKTLMFIQTKFNYHFSVSLPTLCQQYGVYFNQEFFDQNALLHAKISRIIDLTNELSNEQYYKPLRLDKRLLPHKNYSIDYVSLYLNDIKNLLINAFKFKNNIDDIHLISKRILLAIDKVGDSRIKLKPIPMHNNDSEFSFLVKKFINDVIIPYYGNMRGFKFFRNRQRKEAIDNILKWLIDINRSDQVFNTEEELIVIFKEKLKQTQVKTDVACKGEIFRSSFKKKLDCYCLTMFSQDNKQYKSKDKEDKRLVL